MYDGVPTLLDQIAFVHGSRELLARYIAFADRAMRDIGVRLSVSSDFHRLMSLNDRHRDSWPPLLPIFNPAYSSLSSRDAFWIEGVDENGDTVVTSAGRCFNLGDRSLASELRALRIFYDRPAPHIAAGGRVDVTAPSAGRIFGHTMFSGALWVRPDYRRHGLTKIIPRLMRSCALAQWNIPVFWMMITPELDRIGVTRAYGSWSVESGVTMHLPTSQRAIEALFCSMTQATMIHDIASSAEGYDATTANSRWMERHITNSSSLARQGNRTRS
jgi:hypothetical protein